MTWIFEVYIIGSFFYPYRDAHLCVYVRNMYLPRAVYYLHSKYTYKGSLSNPFFPLTFAQ